MVDMRFAVGCIILLLVHLCGAFAVGNTTVKCRDNERLSLLSLKRGFVDPMGWLYSWGIAENQTDCCTWDRVSCDSQTGHVEALYISDCDELEGTISPSLAELHYLTRLNLGHNNFNSSQFPTFILSLKRLQYLDLSFANLKGNIPLQLGYSLPHLQELNLYGNQLEGGIPKSLAELHHLTYLDLDGNNFNSSQFPTFIFSLKRLQYLDLSGTNLKGNIQSLDQLEGGITKSLALCSLTHLDLRNNSLSGQLDDFVASFRHCSNISLQFLDLSYNRLTGAVPDFSQFSFLEILSLNNNRLNGTLNAGIGLLSNLGELDISSNSLQGVISETHFRGLSQLGSLDMSFNIDLEFKISPDWIPPFQLYEIGLASCKLGPDFPIWLQTQKSCHYINISNAEISSTIPSWFWNLTFRYLDISNNKITGGILNFQVHDKVTVMDFSSNLFEGSIPSSLSKMVTAFLDLSNNKFTDASTLLCPNETVDLNILDLSDNQLSGTLPDCWEQFDRLQYLNVANNSLFGKIPTSMDSLINIQSLHLGFNKFSGEIPLSLNKCTELVLLDVAGNNFSGLIPSWIGDGLENLRFLILRSNKFSGSLPRGICDLSQLQILDLSMNNISGNLPKCLNRLSALVTQNNFDATIVFGRDDHYMLDTLSSKQDFATLVWKGKAAKYRNILRLVKSIDLSSNMLTGEIPSELMDLVGLVALNLSRNMISGQIPTTIGQLKSLDFLDISRNHLFGHIPSTLSQIDRLSVMDLSYNNLSGEIPHGTQLQSFDPSTYEGNACLCGAPLPKCPTRPTQGHPPNDENFDEDEQFFNRGFFISLSLGFGTGFWGICSLMFLNKSFTYASFRLVNDIYDKVYVLIAINMAKLRRWRRSAST